VAHFVHEEFDDRLDPHAVDECLDQVAAQFAGASVRSFVPLLVRRYVREELQTRLGQV
jgi:Arc/MetJ family transcription regulator